MDGGFKKKSFSKAEYFSVFYHNLFDYPLTFADLIKWSPGGNFLPELIQQEITFRNGYYFLKGNEQLAYKKTLRSNTSKKKIEIAKKASQVLSILPSVQMVAITGSASMGNAQPESDIDILIITKSNRLWATRAASYVLLKIAGFGLRTPGETEQKDKLCLNMWMDEGDLVWRSKDRNFYTAHEIAQILPLVNKNGTYEKFLSKNKWILKYWPNSVKANKELRTKNDARKVDSMVHMASFISVFFEKIAYKVQLNHMKPKITREIVTPTRAIFHPNNLSQEIMSKLSS